MDRDPLFLALVALVCGTVAWSLAPLRAGSASGPAWQRERRSWRAVIAPLLVVTFGTAMLVGWAFEEPAQSDERLAPLAWALVVIVSVLWIRAFVRFVRCVTARPSSPLAVVGILRPRIVLDPRLASILDADALQAALAHEAAHVRHRDPLRIALAQLAIDLQWPWQPAKLRLSAWRAALEEARDDEAVADGVHPEDLAEAIVATARLATGRGGAALGDHAIVARVSRLLDDAPRDRPRHSAWFASMFLAGLAVSFVVGLTLGEDIVGMLPGVLR